MPQIVRYGIGCGLLLAGIGCSSPRAHFFSIDEDIAQSQSFIADRAIFLINPINLPAEVDRPQIVVRDGPDQILISEQERWAAPLKESLPRLIATQLGQHGAHARVVTSVPAMAPSAAASVAIDVARFDVSRRTGATVVMRWIYRPSGGESAPLGGESVGRAPIERDGFDGLVEALRSAVEIATAHLAQQLPQDR